MPEGLAARAVPNVRATNQRLQVRPGIDGLVFKAKIARACVALPRVY